MKSNLICTSCPYGCQLAVDHDEDKIGRISGNRCRKGREYAEQELFNPRRIVTTTVYISGARIGLVSVKTDRRVPKKLMFDIIKAASHVRVKAPVRMGDVLIEDVCRSGANIVATRSLDIES